MDELWEKFLRSGRISDYIKYKRYKSGESNADDVKGSGSSGKKQGRER